MNEKRKKRRLVAPGRISPGTDQTAVPASSGSVKTASAPEPVWEFSLLVRYRVTMRGKTPEEARQRLYAMFRWLHDGIGRWLVPKPFDPWLVTHSIEFPEWENEKEP
jgi:hypothetical protein